MISEESLKNWCCLVYRKKKSDRNMPSGMSSGLPQKEKDYFFSMLAEIQQEMNFKMQKDKFRFGVF